MIHLTDVVRAVLDERPEASIGPDCQLGQIGAWDSMRSINLQLELEEQYHIDLSDLVIPPTMTIRDLASLVEVRGGVLRM